MARKLQEDEIKWILSLDASDAERESAKLNTETKKLTSRNKELKKSLNALEIAGKKNSKQYEEMSDEYFKNTTAINKNRAQMKLMAQQLNVNDLSMSQLKKRARELRRQLDTTSKSLHPKQYKKLSEELTVTKKRMAELRDGSEKLGSVWQRIFGDKGAWAVFKGFALNRAFSNVSSFLSKSIADSIELARQADGVTRAFKRIGNVKLLKNLRKQTKGTVDDLQLMKSVVLANDFRIPLQDMGKYLAFAQLKAQQTGQSVEYLTNSIVTGLGRKSILILDNLGLSSTEINEELAKTGDFMSAVANIVDKQLAAAGDKYVSAADKSYQATTRLKNAQLSLGQALLPLSDQWLELQTQFKTGVIQVAKFLLKNKTAVLSLVGAFTIYFGVVKALHAFEKGRLVLLSLQKTATYLFAAAQAKLTGNTLRATAAMRKFNFVTKTTTIGALIALLATAVISLKSFGRTLKKTSSLLDDVNKEANENVAAERNEVQQLLKIAKDETRSKEERIQALKKMNEISPDYLGNLDLEKVKTGEADTAVKKYTKSLTLLAKARLLSNRIADIENKLGRNAEQDFSKWYDVLEVGSNNIINLFERTFSTAESLVQGRGFEGWNWEQNTTKWMGDAEPAMKRAMDKYQSLKEALVKYQTELDKITKDIFKNKQSATGGGTPKDTTDLVKAKERELKLAKAEVATTPAQVAARNRKVAALERELKALRELGIVQEADKPNSKTRLETEKEVAKSLDDLRKDDLQSQERIYNSQKGALIQQLTDKKISQEQYNMLMLGLEQSTAENRLQVEKNYLQDAQSLDFKNAEIKEKTVREANARVLKAEGSAANARLNVQRQLNNLIDDFKGKFKLTTVDEDYQAQLKVLKDYYQARKELAIKNNLDTTELDAAYYMAKEQLEADHEQRIFSIRNQYGLTTLQERYNAEQAQLQTALNQKLLSQKEYEEACQNLKRDSYKKQFDYYSNLFSGAVEALQNAEMANIDAKYDAEISAAQGNADEVERLENEKEAKKLAVQKKYADLNFAVKASQIIADTAVSIMKALADLGPIAGPIAASLMGITGAAQLAAAKAERDKVKNMTVSGAGASSSSSSSSRRVVGREKGGSINVTRAQDGRFFASADYDPSARGFIDKPTVIVGEGPRGQSKEWVASNAAVENPTIAPLLNLIDKHQQAGTIRTLDLSRHIAARAAGFATGGTIAPTNTPAPALPPTPVADQTVINKLVKTLDALQKDGLKASVVLTELERKQALRNKSRNIGSK